MKLRIIGACLLFLLSAAGFSAAESFKVFSSGEQSWTAPDGRFLIRTIDHEVAASQLPGSFHTLVLENLKTGNSRPLFDYHGTLALAWSKDDFIIVTEYVNRRIARTLVFAPDTNIDPVVISPRFLAKLLPASIGSHLTSNDHVYVEAATVNEDLLKLRVWGYGARDTNGFSLRCDYDLKIGTAECHDREPSTASVF